VLLHANQSMAWIWLLERQKQLSAATALPTARVAIITSLHGMVKAAWCCVGLCTLLLGTKLR
jgi:hypothetical protein